MERSLTILLPVKHSDGRWAAAVEQLLETAADLTERFEVVLVHRGPSDPSADVAARLATRYPQVRSVDVGGETDELARLVRIALGRTTGEILLVHDGRGPIVPSEIGPLWRLRNDDDLVAARHCATDGSTEATWIERLLGTARPFASTGNAGFRLVRRAALAELEEGARVTTDAAQVRLSRADRPDAASRPRFLGRTLKSVSPRNGKTV